jgi:hypothetical protein
MPGTPFASVLTDEALASAAHAAVVDAAEQLRIQAFRDPREPATGDAEVRRDALAQLRVLTHLQQALEAHMRSVASAAATAGAGYPELGNACRITRQGARRRWPGILPAGSRGYEHDEPDDGAPGT